MMDYSNELLNIKKSEMKSFSCIGPIITIDKIGKSNYAVLSIWMLCYGRSSHSIIFSFHNFYRFCV